MTHVESTRPADWRTATVKSVADVRFSSVDKKTRPGERPVRLCNYLDVYTREYIRGDEPFMAATATEPEIAQFGLRQGDVLLTKDSETPDDIGVPSVIMCERDDLVCGYHLAMLRPDKSQVDSVFLSKQLRLPRMARYFGRMSNGLTRYGLPTAAVENAELWLPPDVTEQTRIAAVLQRVDATIARTERGIAKLKLIKAGLLQDLLTRGIDDNGDLRDPAVHPEQFKDSSLGKVPETWDVVPIAALGTIVAGGTPSRGVPSYWGGGVPWVTPSEITILTDMCVRATRETISPAGVAASAATILPVGSLLVTTRATIGAIALAGCPLTTNQGFKSIVPNETANSEFFYYGLHMAVPEMIKRAIGSTFQEISKSQFERILVRRPTITEQERILQVLLAADCRIKTESGKVMKLNLIKQGLMHDLLTGHVRVPLELGETHARDTAGDGRRSERKANIYFMRSVLAAEIVEQMHEHATFGHVKFQKTLFLCERVAGLDLETRYHRAAAGPHDNRLMRSVDGQMKKQKWFRVVPRGVGADGKPVGWAYERMEKAGGHREWFEKYWAAARERIQRVIDMLRPLDTRRCEVVATLYSAWEDLLAAGREATDDAIVNEVLTNWHESKQAIPRDTWIRALGWMRKQELQPATIGTR